MSGFQEGLRLLEDARTLFGVLQCLAATDLCRLSTASKHAHEWDSSIADSVWCHLCKVCWQEKSRRYHLNRESALLLASSRAGRTWREVYKQAWLEGRRGSLRPSDLNTLRWAFNFTPRAGGRGAASMQFVEFTASEPGSSAGLLHMGGFLPLPYQLSPDGRVLEIANFTPHHVRRLHSWEWEITNDNVTFVSCLDGDVEYSDRGFLNVTMEDIMEEIGDGIPPEEVQAFLQRGRTVRPARNFWLYPLLHSMLLNRLER